MYDELYEAWIKEKGNVEIQPLAKDFCSKLADYVRRLKEEKRMLDNKTVRGRLIDKEEENVRRLINNLIQVRYEKIINKITNGEIVPISVLTEEEEELYRVALPQAESYSTFLKSILQGRLPKSKEKAPGKKLLVVRILREIPAIIGSDLKTYGPFKPEDIASLPIENAKILIKQGAAVEIETR